MICDNLSGVPFLKITPRKVNDCCAETEKEQQIRNVLINSMYFDRIKIKKSKITHISTP
jgi:hypothetical protein